MRSWKVSFCCLALSACGPGLNTGYDLENPDPARIAGLKAWFRADDFVDRVTSGAAVGAVSWNGKSGGALTPLGSPEALWFHSGAPGGHPFVRLFNSGGKEFYNSTFNFGMGLSGMTFFVVAGPGSGSGSAGRLVAVSSTASFVPGTDAFFQLKYSPTTLSLTSEVSVPGQTLASPGTATAFAAGAYWMGTFIWSGEGTGFMSYGLRGASNESGTASALYGSTQALSPSTYLYIGQDAGPGADVAEVLGYTRRLDFDEIELVHQYLSKRYGLW